MTVLHNTRTETGWLVVIRADSGMTLSMSFDHKPNDAEIAANLAAFEAPAATIEVEAEDGSVV